MKSKMNLVLSLSMVALCGFTSGVAHAEATKSRAVDCEYAGHYPNQRSDEINFYVAQNGTLHVEYVYAEGDEQMEFSGLLQEERSKALSESLGRSVQVFATPGFSEKSELVVPSIAFESTSPLSLAKVSPFTIEIGEDQSRDAYTCSTIEW